MGVIRPFGLGDLLLLYRLQGRGACLDLCHALAGSEPPAWVALTAPFRGWWGGEVVTYVSRRAGEGSLAGAIQMRRRPGRPEADIVFIAPALEDGEEVAALWHRLLAHCVRQAGERRVQRVFISAPEQAREMLSLFRQAGFSPYTREEVFRGEELVRPVLSQRWQVRPLASADGWALQKLYATITPRLVQQAEGGGSPSGDQSLPWRAPGPQARFVLARGGEIAGLVSVRAGRSGHCLRLWGDFQTSGEVLALLGQGLAALSAHPPRPIYCLVREYQGGVRGPLVECGFRHVATWSRLVKHTVLRVREPAWRTLPVLEPRPEPTVPGAASSSMQ